MVGFFDSNCVIGRRSVRRSGIAGEAEEYPNAPVILGHSGGTLAGYDEAIEAAKKRENVFLETCGSSVVYGMIERLVREVGADRILFGSDMPFVNANAQIGKILYANVSST